MFQQGRRADGPVNKNRLEKEREKCCCSLRIRWRDEVFEEEESQINEELVAVLKANQGMLLALRDIPKKKLLEEATEINKALIGLKAHSIPELGG